MGTVTLEAAVALGKAVASAVVVVLENEVNDEVVPVEEEGDVWELEVC